MKLVEISFKTEHDEMRVISETKNFLKEKFDAWGIDHHVRDLEARGR